MKLCQKTTEVGIHAYGDSVLDIGVGLFGRYLKGGSIWLSKPISVSFPGGALGDTVSKYAYSQKTKYVSHSPAELNDDGTVSKYTQLKNK